MRRLAAAGAALAVLLVLALPGPSGATGQRSADVFTGFGFETCTAPSVAALTAWSASPYRAVGIYLGGVNRACRDGNLSSSWVATTLSMGWSLLPLYVGLQAPCVSDSGLAKISSNPTTAAAQGSAAADDAVSKSNEFGLPAGSPLYLDVEGYATNNASCTRSVQAFVGGWVGELRAIGYVAGVYGSAASTIRDVAVLGASIPDAVWIANWNGVQGVFGDPHVSDTLWASHQRVHQYKGGHDETWGGVKLNVDDDYVDGPVVGGVAAPLPPPTTTPSPAVPTTGGAVGSGDGKAAASWPAQAFAEPVVVTLTPTSQPATTTGYAVQLTVTRADTQAAVDRFDAPLTLHLLVPAAGLQPSYSADGTHWRALPKLAAGAVPVDAGYALDPDGTPEIQTFLPGYYGLRTDTTPPTQPPAFAGRFNGAALVLQWQGATDDSGTVASYQVLLDGTPVQTLKGSSRRAVVRAFHPGALTVYRVRAVDPSGNLGKVSHPVAVRPRLRPATVPKALPRWAFSLFEWQHTGGKRPATAPKKPPAWYWTWAAWRLTPYRIAG
ncbi:MAG TPA: DUF1906 domain-containing protein [Gaiellaceae bacterium]